MGPKVTPRKTGKSPDLTYYFSNRAQFDKIKNIFEKIIVFGPPGGPTFTGPKVNPVQNRKVTRFDALFLEKGPI